MFSKERFPTYLFIYLFAEPEFDEIEYRFTDSKKRKPLNKLDIKQAYSAIVKNPTVGL